VNVVTPSAAGALGVGTAQQNLIAVSALNVASQHAGVALAATTAAVGVINADKAKIDAIAAITGLGNNSRSANSVSFASPTMGGFTLGVGFTNDKAKRSPTTPTTTVTTQLNDVTGQSFSLAYASGPLSVNAVTSRGKMLTRASLSAIGDAHMVSKTAGNAISVRYDLGIAVPYIAHEESSAKVSNIAILEGVKASMSATEIGVRVPMGKFTPYLAAGFGDTKITGAGLLVVDNALLKTETESLQIGTTYELSKRTSAYISHGTDKQKNKVLGSNKRSGMQAGLVHTF
jgi:predicted porin